MLGGNSYPACERYKKTIMIDGHTRDQLDYLTALLDVTQTDIYRRGVSIMHALHADSMNGKEIRLITSAGEQTPLDFDYTDGFEDERKMTLKFNDETLGKVQDLAEALSIYPTYVFRRAVSTLRTIHAESILGHKVVLVDKVSGETETVRFF
jgi:hypothetical protein